MRSEQSQQLDTMLYKNVPFYLEECYLIVIFYLFHCSYFLVNFDSPGTPLISLLDHLQRDLDIIRPRILRKEEEVTRPCEKGPCDFGELDEEKKRTVKLNLRNLVKKL